MKKLLNSFKYAIQGLYFALKTQQNMRIHAVAVVVVTVVGIFLKLSAIEWGVIAIAMGFVLAAEMTNSALEALVDIVSPEYNEKAGKIKDMAAGAVLITAIIAAVVGTYIFGNRLFNLIFY